MARMLQAALAYRKLGFSVIPVRPDKKPFIKWEAYQKEHASEEDIKAWWQQYPSANVGIVTGIISGIAVIDLDDVEKARPALSELIPDSLVFPIAQTPSSGEHWYFKCPDDSLTNNARTIPGADLRCNGGYVVAAPSIGSNGIAYQWLEGLKPGKIELPELPPAYVDAVRAGGIKPQSEALSLYKKNKENSLSLGDVTLSFEEGCRDNDLFSVANALAKGGMSDGDIVQTLARIASSWGEGHLTEWFTDKVASAIKRREHREISVQDELNRYITVTDGAFSVSDCDNALRSVSGVTLCYRNSIRQSLLRMKRAGLIKPWGSKDGWYIRIDNATEEIDWWNADENPLDLKFPLNIDEFAVTYPKNIAVLAGEPNSGKTAYLLNFARMNMNKHKVTYCSSEMGGTELKKRLLLFDTVPLSDWKAIRFVERVANFADVIDPDGVNIIDFMELNDNFYLIGQYLRDIHDKLDKGFCFVGIQKDSNKEAGRGGTMGLEKPRLYLNMGRNMLTILKAKAWKDHSVNPNGLTCQYKLINGSRFTTVNGWDYQK